MARTYVGFNVDTTEAAALTGFLQKLSIDIKSARHISPVLKYTHVIMSQAFTEYMATVAPAQQSRFHHVYEWGQVGDPTAKLWDDKLIGNGANRTATFTWRASKQTVPVRPDFKEVGVKQIHVFVWKAPVMEYGKNIVIEPKRGKFISYFTGPTDPESKYPGPGGEEPTITTNPIRVTDPGGAMVKGSFTAEYVAWWGGSGAQGVFESSIRRVLEEDLGKMPIESATKPFRRARAKKLSIASIADAEAAQRAGAAAAKKFLEARSRKYIEAARAREGLIG
ncbi:hypothetical protein SEA_TUNATARTARE_33 [Streptomyces phage TunaTartare]|uniref:Uncharacterized protein n=1 Tax=Streptomyces phage TunaTartare TaxID=2848887 RepID=A0A8F2E6Y3_9CAUD|nr:hypothetical protein PP457_gp217 [Streptomyces phage TunaTartare]QWT29926.1 hypothetical protein SEA_TUNATARTARE_33 [Streptomyces phage TunaTartare]